jgi:RNA polymerase sigma factor (sigma-70 family)
MAGGLLPVFLRQLRKSLAAAAADEGLADADLLERFLARRDEEAFAALVGRHGPMVLGVCARVLGDAHAAEDAFQATFLILVRRAGAIRKHAALGSWLHGVAYRAALKARTREACRRRHEREAIPTESTDSARDFWRDLRPVLDAALDHLPKQYRAPLVLCYLEGKTQQEAARLLGWRPGTLATRLRRGLARLRVLLARRGVALSGAGLTVALVQSSASDAVAAGLVRSTVGHAVAVLAGSAADGAVPVSIQVLVSGVLRNMKSAKIGQALLVAVAAVLLGGVALLWQQRHVRAAMADPAAEPAAVRLPAAEQAGAKKDLELLQGTWNINTMGWGGKSLPKELMTGYKFVFAGTRLTWEGAIGMQSMRGKVTAMDGVFPCDFKIDPGQNPKHIDITLHLKKVKKGDRTVLGIYEIKGDTLKVYYFASNTGRRPTEFATKDNRNIGYIVLTRAKK